MKEESKMYEGDPQIRNRIRNRFRELLRQNISVAVPRADVVITNPTHYAVALEYQWGGAMPSPMVCAKGADDLAARIRKIAQDNDIPLVENKPLAQALYKEVNVGEMIPSAYFNVIAQIYKKVMDINDLRRKTQESKRSA
jgi:flagellar biosynthetic protein FlhB